MLLLVMVLLLWVAMVSVLLWPFSLLVVAVLSL